MIGSKYRQFQSWWATAQSSVITHRYMKWFWVALWGGAEVTGLIEQVSFISRLSLVALILGSWSAEEAAQAAARQEAQESQDGSP